MKFYAVEQIGPNRYKTPEGFLVCVGVPLARTGTQIYGPGENPIDPGPDGVIHIDRTPEHVFRPATIASANGKDVCDEHPDEDVMPHNYRQLTCGVILDPRRGEGADADLLVGDLMVKHFETIAAIDAGKKEVSLGYDADYVKTGEGRGEQRNIIINHIALVDRGRCGPRCSISDHHHEHQPTTPAPEPVAPACGCHSKETSIMKTLKQRVLDALKGKVKDEEAEAIAKEVEKTSDSEGGAIHVHLGGGEKKEEGEYVTKDEFAKHVEANNANFKGVTDSIAALTEAMKGKTGDEKKEGEEETAEEKATADEAAESEGKEDEKEKNAKTRDSAYLEEPFSQTLADADIIAPGIKAPLTFDRAMKPAKTYKDGICGLRRRALDAAYNNAERPQARAFIDQQLAGRTFNVMDEKTFPCRRVTDLFRGTVAMQKTLNNGQVGVVTLPGTDGKGTVSPGFGSTEAVSASTLAEQAAAAWK